VTVTYPYLSKGAPYFKGRWRNFHGLEFPSVRRCSVPHAKSSDFTDTGIHEAICIPTTSTYLYQLTGISSACDTDSLLLSPLLRRGNYSSQMLKIFGLFPMKTYEMRLKIFAHNLLVTSKMVLEKDLGMS
jgi:hypothetical protein